MLEQLVYRGIALWRDSFPETYEFDLMVEMEGAEQSTKPFVYIF